MKFFLNIFGIIFFVFSNYSLADQNLIESLKEGKKLIFIRHAYAPGNGDPNNFTLKDCSSQRNLDHKGIQQSKKIGIFFSENRINLDKILSSEWCRCIDTAKIAFKNYETFNALNSFYDPQFAKNKNEQLKNLKEYIK